MDGSRKVSLRNRQFVRKIDTPMTVTASGVKPSQFYNAQHIDIPDVQPPQGEDAGSGRGNLGNYLRARLGLTVLEMMEEYWLMIVRTGLRLKLLLLMNVWQMVQ